ncbi:MAG: DUF1003 domain-containing protein [Aggregatilineales bacterium]
MPIQFPKPYAHNHPPVKDVNAIFEEHMTFGNRAADTVAGAMGSWRFIIIQSVILFVWIVANSVAWIKGWDPYPFILMNLVLSTQAAFTAPIIMMSQGRQAIKDRLEAHNDYLINQKSEEELRVIMEHLTAQDKALQNLQQTLDNMQATLNTRNQTSDSV